MTESEKYQLLLKHVRLEAKTWLTQSDLDFMKSFSYDHYERIIKARLTLESIGETGYSCFFSEGYSTKIFAPKPKQEKSESNNINNPLNKV